MLTRADRVFYYPGARYDNALLVQAFSNIFTQVILAGPMHLSQNRMLQSTRMVFDLLLLNHHHQGHAHQSEAPK